MKTLRKILVVSLIVISNISQAQDQTMADYSRYEYSGKVEALFLFARKNEIVNYKIEDSNCYAGLTQEREIFAKCLNKILAVLADGSTVQLESKSDSLLHNTASGQFADAVTLLPIYSSVAGMKRMPEAIKTAKENMNKKLDNLVMENIAVSENTSND